MTNQTSPTLRRANRLYKDPIDRKIGGVAAGVAKYFDIDTTLVRTVWAVSIVLGGFGLLLYLVLWFILDDDPDAYAEPIAHREVEPAEIEQRMEEDDVEPPTEGDEPLDRAEQRIESETVDADATPVE